MIKVRKTKILLLVISAAISLFSLKDKAMVVTVPNTTPVVAEAYHAPAQIQPPSFAGTYLATPAFAAEVKPQALTGSPSVYSLEADSLSEDNNSGNNEITQPVDVSAPAVVPVQNPVTKAEAPAAAPATTIVFPSIVLGNIILVIIAPYC